MLFRLVAPAVGLALFAPPAMAQLAASVAVPGASVAVTYNTVVVVQPAPPPVVVVRPVAPRVIVMSAPAPATVVAAPPPVIVVHPVPAPVVADVAPAAETEPAEDGSFDLLAFGRYRNAFDLGETGGVTAALRLVLNSKLSLEGKFGYLDGGTASGGDLEEAPLDFSLVWYPWTRRFPIYFAFGGGFTWTSAWHADYAYAPATGTYASGGSSDDVWFVGTRAACGVEFELWHFLLLTAESEFFYRWRTAGPSTSGGPGVSVDVGLGVRL